MVLGDGKVDIMAAANLSNRVKKFPDNEEVFMNYELFTALHCKRGFLRAADPSPTKPRLINST